MIPSVLGPSLCIVTGIKWHFLSVTDGRKTIGAHTGSNQILFSSYRAMLAERKVVFIGAPLIAMTLNGYADHRMFPQPGSILFQLLLSFVTQGRAVELKEHITDNRTGYSVIVRKIFHGDI